MQNPKSLYSISSKSKICVISCNSLLFVHFSHVSRCLRSPLLAFPSDEHGDRHLRSGCIPAGHIMNQSWKYVVDFNEHNQPLRKAGSMLVRFLGYVAKHERWCPIGEESWHKVNKKYKADIVELVRTKFLLPSNVIVDKKCLGHVGKSWRNFRYYLKSKHFNPEERTKQQIFDDVPKGHSSYQWIRLVEYWSSKRFQKLSECGKEARGSLSHLHITGSTSFAEVRADFEKMHGRKPSYLELYELTHKIDEGESDDGIISGKFVEFARAKVEECAPTSSKSRVLLENEVFNKLMYDENSKRPIGFGFGVNKSAVFGVSAELNERGFTYNNDDNSSQVENMRMELETTKKYTRALEEQNQALKEMNAKLEKQNQERDITAQQHNEIISQLLIAVRGGGPLSDTFFEKAQSFLSRKATNDQDNGEKPCELLLLTPYRTVAKGKVHNKSDKLHNRSLPPNHAKVEIETFEEKEKDTPLPVPDADHDLIYIKDAVGTFVAWPIDLIAQLHKI